MITLFVLTVIVMVAVSLARRARRRRHGARAVGGSRRSRPAALMLVIGVLAFSTVATGPPALASECGEAPNPERPGTGLVGALDPAEGHGAGGSAYVDYGYAGMVWNVYESECGPLSGVTDPNSTIDTWAGNQLFNVGKTIVGATNSLHYTVMEGGLLTPLYNAVKSGAEKVYNNIYGQLFGLVALVLAIMMFRNIWRGDLSAVSKRALFALGGIWLAASSFAMLRYYDQIDKAIVQTTTNIQAGFVDESENTVIRHALPTTLHDRVVYDNWLRGEFGASDAAQAKQFGRPLLDAQAFTWGELRNGDDANAGVVDGKKQAYKDISTQLGPATGYFTGEDGSRTGAGFLAFGQSIVYSLFQFFAKAAVLLAQILVRLFTLTAPLIGLVAMLHHDTLRRVAKVVGAVAFNLVVLSVLAGVHSLLVQAIFGASETLSVLTQMVLAGLVTVLMFLVGKPARRLWQMVEMSVSMVGTSIPAPHSGLFSRFRRKNNTQTPQDAFWQNARDPDESEDTAANGPMGSTAGSGRFRPEATVFANSQRMDTSPMSRVGTAGARPHRSKSSGGPAIEGPRPTYGLPAGGGAGRPALPGQDPGIGSPGDYVLPASTAHRSDGVQPVSSSRRAGAAAVSDNFWDRDNDPDPFVVPSTMTSGNSTPRRQAGNTNHSVRPSAQRDVQTGHDWEVHNGPNSDRYGRAEPHYERDPSASPAQPRVQPQPRRANSEVVAGKPVFVLYRPSRGLEVRDDVRDTDSVVR